MTVCFQRVSERVKSRAGKQAVGEGTPPEKHVIDRKSLTRGFFLVLMSREEGYVVVLKWARSPVLWKRGCVLTTFLRFFWLLHAKATVINRFSEIA